MSTEPCPTGALGSIDVRRFRQDYHLRNGQSVTVRAVRPDDRDRIRMAFQELEPSTVFNRFHGPKKVLSESDLDRVVDVDHRRVVSLLATIDVGGEEVVIGGAQYVALAQPPDHAEIAFTIEEDFQGNGLGTILLRDLARIARQQGFTALEAYVLHTNHAMLRVFQGSGLPIVSRLRGDSIQIELDLCKPLS